MVVKRALDRLRVKDEWFADRRRNRSEQDYFAYVGKLFPGVVPRVLHSDPVRGWFAMEFIDGETRNWKSELLAGRADPAAAARAGDTLGRIHRASWGDPEARERFDTLENFTQLRIAPYLLSTAERVPELGSELLAEASRLGATRLALVHGDYNPKNLMVATNRLVILDAEVAWYGDPAFDMGFLLTHFQLKALYHSTAPEPMLGLATEAWRSYAAAVGPADPGLEARTARLVLCLMLARIHGKSPVEYLTGEEPRRRVTDFVRRNLPRPPPSIPGLVAAWREALE
jgi:tRNA A-37 threonylcarbamoyl transferase component Bud32